MFNPIRSQVTRPHTQASRLPDRLAAFARRVAVEREDCSGLAQVLHRIDETILPRALSVTTNTGARVQLLVSNRRLMRVETDQNPAAVADAPADPEAAAASFSERLAPILTPHCKITIRSVRYTLDAIFWDVGCGAARLAALMGVNLHPEERHGVQKCLQSLLQPHAIARAELSLSGQVLSRQACEQSQPILEALLDWIVETPSNSATLTGNTMHCSCLPLSDQQDALIIEHSEGHTVVITPAEMRDQLLSSWHSSAAKAAKRAQPLLH